jgi:hypothetical protein
MIKKLLVAAALGTVMSTSAVYAGPFQIDVGFDASGNGSTSTGSIDELGYTGTLATSIYLGDPGTPGTAVVDTNIESVMNAYGFASIAGTPYGGPNPGTFSYPLDPSQKNIASLNPINTFADNNGFTNGITVPYGTPVGDGVFWGLTYDYHIEGVTTAAGVDFNSGFFDVFYENGTDRIQVLRLNVTGSDLEVANLDIFGNVSYDFNGDGTDDAAGDSFVQNFFIDVESGLTFYELWESGFAVGNLMSVRWILDTNVNPPLPSADQLAMTDTGALIRQTTLDGSVGFQVVPEPWTLGLFGAGLLALGFAARRRRDQA